MCADLFIVVFAHGCPVQDLGVDVVLRQPLQEGERLGEVDWDGYFGQVFPWSQLYKNKSSGKTDSQ